MVTDQEIAKGVETVIRQAEPNAVTTLTLNGVVQQLEAKLGQNLSHKAAFIRDQINNNLLLLGTTAAASQQQHPQQQQHFPPPSHFALQFQHQQPQQHPQQQQHFPPTSHFTLHHHASQQQSQVYPQFRAAHDLNFRQPLQPPLPRHPVQAPPAKESAPTGVKRRGGPGGLNKVCGVSPELQAIVGEPALPRTEIVKKLWAYIRKYNLQDPNNKRKIVCDDALRVVFETDSTDMFKMNKLLAKHILPIDTKDSEKAKKLKVDVESTTESTDPSKTTVMISEALAKFLGVDGREMLKSEAEQHVWDYIKANQLEDPLNSMAILCDDKLRELLGCDSISALGISEMLKRHFT